MIVIIIAMTSMFLSVEESVCLMGESIDITYLYICGGRSKKKEAFFGLNPQIWGNEDFWEKTANVTFPY